MKKIILASLLSASVFLTGVVQAKEYNSGLKTTISKITVTFEFVKNKDAVKKRWHEESKNNPYSAKATIHAFTYYPNNALDTCSIVMPKPNNWNDGDSFDSIGHEIMHCLGAVHPGE